MTDGRATESFVLLRRWAWKLVQQRWDAANLPIFQSYLDTARMEWSWRKDILHYTFRKPAGALVFFQDNSNFQTGVYFMTVFSIHIVESY